MNFSAFKNNFLSISYSAINRVKEEAKEVSFCFKFSLKQLNDLSYKCFCLAYLDNDNNWKYVLEEQYQGLFLINPRDTWKIIQTVNNSKDLYALLKAKVKLEADLECYQLKLIEVKSYEWKLSLEKNISVINDFLYRIDNKISYLKKERFEDYLMINPNDFKTFACKTLSTEDNFTDISCVIMLHALIEVDFLSYQVNLPRQKQNRLLQLGKLFYDFLDKPYEGDFKIETFRKFQPKPYLDRIKKYEMLLKDHFSSPKTQREKSDL